MQVLPNWLKTLLNLIVQIVVLLSSCNTHFWYLSFFKKQGWNPFDNSVFSICRSQTSEISRHNQTGTVSTGFGNTFGSPQSPCDKQRWLVIPWCQTQFWWAQKGIKVSQGTCIQILNKKEHWLYPTTCWNTTIQFKFILYHHPKGDV